jgi:serralysin
MISIRRPIVLIALCLSGCWQGPVESHEDGRPTILEEGYEEAWESYLAMASPTADGGLKVEGDLYFASENELRRYFDERMSEESDKAHAFQQISTGYIPAFAFPERVNIRYCVSNAFGTGKATWAGRIREAADAWEAVTNVRFRYLSQFDAACTSATAGVDFAVVRQDGLQGYCGASKLNWTGCPATGVVIIDTLQDVTFGGASPNVTPTGALRHELGHVLGLRHEHPWRSVVTGSCPEPAQVPALNTGGVQLGNEAYDQNSVMHYPFDGTAAGAVDCGGNEQSDFSISTFDEHSIQVLYGMHPAWIASLPIL